MKTTNHFLQKMRQRGITAEMVNTAFVFGKSFEDRIVLDRKIIKTLIKKYSDQKPLLMKLYDKGGITLVLSEDTIITVYNSNFNNHKRLRKLSK